nr:hypothetical protein [uncultured bacterium]
MAGVHHKRNRRWKSLASRSSQFGRRCLPSRWSQSVPSRTSHPSGASSGHQPR